jgi:calcium-dependent protein kinase
MTPTTEKYNISEKDAISDIGRNLIKQSSSNKGF